MRNTSGLWRGGSPGRPVGVPNRATRDVRSFCQQLIEDPEYRANFEQRWRTGRLPPALEQMVWNYAWGKPPQALRIRSERVTLEQLVTGDLPPELDEDAS